MPEMSPATARDATQPLKAPDVFLAAVWFGLVAGLIEGLWLTFSRYGLGVNTLMGPHVIWLAVVMDVLWLLIPGVILAAVALVWRSPAATRPLMFGLAFPAATAVCFLAMLTLHTYAMLVIALGIAVQASAVISRRPAGFVRLVRRSTPVLIGITGLLAALVFGVMRFQERRAIAGLPAPTKGSPNVLLLILDTARSMSMSLDGFSQATTPRLEAYAHEGVNFLSALSPSSWTLPSHASMFTGYLPHQLSTGYRTPLDATQPTVAEELAHRGYATGGFVANLHYASREFGLQRGFIHYADYAISPGELFLNSSLGRYLSVHRWFRRAIRFYDILGRKDAARLDGELLGWLDQRTDGRPFFAFVNYYDVHEPYLPPAAFDRKFASATKRKLYQTDQSIRGARALGKLDMTPAEMQREHEAYMASLNYLDSEIGNLLDVLKQRGLLDNTIVIITGDHGEQFGEHGYVVHGNSLYAPVMRVPLLLSYPPAVPRGKTDSTWLNLRDLPATIFDLTGTTPQRPFPGRSLRSHWDSTIPASDDPMLFEVITSDKPVGVVEKLRSVVWRGESYIRHESGKEEAYDLNRDPGEANDQIADPAFASQAAALRSAMDSILKATGPDRWGH
jgi:arylsulfatase A-like enzyme